MDFPAPRKNCEERLLFKCPQSVVVCGGTRKGQPCVDCTVGDPRACLSACCCLTNTPQTVSVHASAFGLGLHPRPPLLLHRGELWPERESSPGSACCFRGCPAGRPPGSRQKNFGVTWGRARRGLGAVHAARGLARREGWKRKGRSSVPRALQPRDWHLQGGLWGDGKDKGVPPRGACAPL